MSREMLSFHHFFVILLLSTIPGVIPGSKDLCRSAILAANRSGCLKISPLRVEAFSSIKRSPDTVNFHLINALRTSPTTKTKPECRKTIVDTFDSCIGRDKTSLLYKMPTIPFRDALTPLQQISRFPATTPIRKRAAAPIGLADLFNIDDPKCADTIIAYGSICLGIFSSVLADAEALGALNRTLRLACATDWRKCLSNVRTLQGSLDPAFRLAITHYNDLCGNDCWNKTFAVVKNCLPPENPIRQSYLEQFSFISDYLEVMCLQSEDDVPCGRLELEFYFMRRGLEIMNSSAICNLAALKEKKCPSACKDELSAAASFLKCCLGSQLRVPDPDDVIGYKPYFDQCGVVSPAPCNEQHIDVRQRSKACNSQLKRLSDTSYVSSTCALHFDDLIEIIIMTEDIAQQVICVDGENFAYCITELNFRLRDLAYDAPVLCQPECFKALEETFEICAADLNLTAAARLPLTFLCYYTSKLDPVKSNCAVKYQEFIESDSEEDHKILKNSCSHALPVKGQCPFSCLSTLNDMIDKGLGCCLGSQYSGNFSALDRIYFTNLQLCLPHVEGGIPPDCAHVPSTEKTGLSVGIIVAIVIGCVALVVVSIVAIYFLRKSKAFDTTDGPKYQDLSKESQ